MPRNTRGRGKRKAFNRDDLSPKQNRQLGRIKRTGIAKITGDESLATIKRKIARVAKQHPEELSAKQNFFVTVPKGKHHSKLMTKAKALGLRTTDKGFFYEREGANKAKLTVTKTGNARIIVTKEKTSKTTGRQRREHRVIPLETPDQLIKQENRLKREAEALLPLAKGESISFKVTEKGREGFSRDMFSSAEQVVKYISHYEKRPDLNTDAKRALWKNYFFRHVEIIKTTRTELRQRKIDREDRYKRERRLARARLKRERKKNRKG